MSFRNERGMIRVQGTVSDSNPHRQADWLRIELWVRGGGVPLGVAYTGSTGDFRMAMATLDEFDELYFKIFDDDRSLRVLEHPRGRAESTIYVRLETDSSRHESPNE